MAGLNSADVVVIGGGISGLTAAHRLTRAGVSVILLESAAQIGGMIGSVSEGEYLLERGPNSSLARTALLDLIDDLEIGERLVFPSAACRKRFISPAGNQGAALFPIPRSLKEALKSPLLSASAKLRVLLEPLIPRTKKEDESVKAFMTRRLGREITSRLVATMLTGIWAADVSKLSCRSALPKIWEAEQKSGSLFRGFAQSAAKRSIFGSTEKKQRAGSIVSFRGGMKDLLDGLIAQIPAGTVSRNSDVQGIERQGTSLLVRYVKRIPGTESGVTKSIRCSQVVLTTPAPVTAALLKSSDGAVAQKIAAVPYAPLGVLHVVYKRNDVIHPLDGFGFLAEPQAAQYLLGAIFNSSLFPNRAPKDEHLLTCFVGGSNNPSASDVTKREVQNAAVRELNQLIGATNHPRILRSEYYQAAIPNFPLQHHRLQQSLDLFHSQNPQFRVIGNWLRGISVAERIEAAIGAADSLLEGFRIQHAGNWS